MLPRSKRLNLKKDFKWVASGKKLDSKYAKIFIRMGVNPIPRLGIAVSSRLFSKTTERNRIKRVLSSAFEPLLEMTPQNINIVVLPKQNIIGVKSGDVLMEVEGVLRGEHIIE